MHSELKGKHMKKDNFPSEKQLKKMRTLLSKGIASRPLPEHASAVDRIKYSMCQKIVTYKNDHKLSQRALAELIGENESLVSKVTHYHFDEFTIDRLVKFLSKLYPKAEMKIEVA
jgi:predicted XRE-type DNA-binding protein